MGYIRKMGQTDCSSAVRGGRWINDGINNHRLAKDRLLPEGWVYGRLLKGGFLGNSHFPIMAGDENPMRKNARKKYGDLYVPTKDPWYGRANQIIARCKIHGIELGFSSTHELARYLISIAPMYCPVFGIELKPTSGAWHPDAPSVDRKDPTKGYVRGNLQIISMKANKMKNDASQEDLEKFAEWVLRCIYE